MPITASTNLNMVSEVKNKPLVSCIIIFLNEEVFIKDAIDSVFAQTYDNWELLLVDDGSTDSSTVIAQQCALQYPEKVCYLEHENHQNRGMSASRNLGISKAKGEFIAFLDADDFWLPFKLETQVPILYAQSKAAILYGTTLFWHGTERSVNDPAVDFTQILGVRANSLFEPPDLLTILLKNEDIHPANCSLLIRSQLFKTLGGFEDDFGSMYEDSVFLAKAFLEASVFVTGDCSAVYRQHPNSTCNLAVQSGTFHPTEPNAARGAFLRWLETYLISKGFKNTEVWRTLQRELWPYAHPVAYRRLQHVARLWFRVRRLLKRNLRC